MGVVFAGFGVDMALSLFKLGLPSCSSLFPFAQRSKILEKLVVGNGQSVEFLEGKLVREGFLSLSFLNLLHDLLLVLDLKNE